MGRNPHSELEGYSFFTFVRIRLGLPHIDYIEMNWPK